MDDAQPRRGSCARAKRLNTTQFTPRRHVQEAMDPSASICVITNPVLFSNIISFQRGISMAVFVFWESSRLCIHTTPEKRHEEFRRNLPLLLNVVIESDNAHILELLYVSHDYHKTDYRQVVRLSLSLKKLKVLAWATRRRVLQRKEVRRCFLVAVRNFTSCDNELLDALKERKDLESIVSKDELTAGVLYPTIKSIAIVKWLHTNLPHLEWDPHELLESGVHAGDVGIVKFVFDQFPGMKWGPALLRMEFPSSMIKFKMGSLPQPGYVDCIRYLFDHHGSSFQASSEELEPIINQASDALLAVIKDSASTIAAIKTAVVTAIPKGNIY